MVSHAGPPRRTRIMYPEGSQGAQLLPTSAKVLVVKIRWAMHRLRAGCRSILEECAHHPKCVFLRREHAYEKRDRE